MTIALSSNTPRVSYTVNAGATQTAFTVNFEFFDAADLNFYVDGTKKTLTTHYTVTGGSGTTGTINTTSGNTVTGISGNSTIVITREIALARVTDFPSSGAFEVSTLNNELDRFTAISSDLNDDANRGIRLQDFDSAVSMELPLLAARKGTVLGFNASTGVVEAGPAITAVQSLSAVTASINLLGTSAVVEDLGLLATSAIIEDMGLLATSGNVTAMGLLGVSAVITDMGILGTAAIVEDMGFLGTSANVLAMGKLGNDTTIADMAILGTDAIVADLAILGTDDVVADLAILATDAIVLDLAILATDAIVADMALLATDAVIADMAQLANSTIIDDLAILATTAIVADLAILATNANVTAMGLLGTSANVTAQGLLGTSAVVEDMGLLGVAGVIEDMGLLGVAGVIEDMGILGTSANVTAMSNVSGAIANVNTVATNIASVNNFSDVYRIASSAPSASLTAGDLYFNTSTNVLNVYGASGWQNAGSSVNGTSARFHYDIGSAVTSVTGSDASSKTLAYDAGFVDVYVNGVRMSTADVTVTSGDTVTFASALASGDEVDIVAYGTFAVANIVATSALNSGSITSGFGTINNGASAITTTGVGSFGSLDISGAIDVDGTTNLDVVDIDGAVDMASTLTVGGVLTSNGGAVFNELSADVDFRVESNITTNALFVDGATGVVGVGVTPQTDWASAFEVIQYGQAGVLWANNNDNTARIGMNVKYDGALKYINTNKSTNLTLDSAGEFLFEVAPSGSAGSAITYTSAMKIHNNGIVSAPLGIALGVGTANTASNVLDDYEEGTWTCTVTGSSANPSSTVSEGGTYTKIGRMVYAHVQLSNKNTSGASGAVRITGLPFEAGADNQATGNLMTYVGVSMDVDASNISPYVQATGASFYASKHQAGWAEITHNPVSNFYLSFSVTYVV